MTSSSVRTSAVATAPRERSRGAVVARAPAKARAGRPAASNGAEKLIVDGELVLYGSVGEGIFGDFFTAREVVDALATMRGDITVRVNSGGGSVFDGLAIYEALKKHRGKVTVKVDGIAASAASVIAMAGKHVIVPASAQLMVHRSWTLTAGNAVEHEKTRDILQKIDGQLVAIYAKRTGRKPAYIEDLLDDETWMTGEEAVDLGFADALSDEQAEAFAAFDYQQYANTPKDVAAAQAKPAKTAKPSTVRELEHALLDIGFSKSRAKELAGVEFRTASPRDDRRTREWADLAAYITSLAKGSSRTCVTVH